MDQHEALDWARTLLEAKNDRRTLAPITNQLDLSMQDAYAIQQALTTLRLLGGQRVVGWKLGYTSEAMRQQMGVTQPNYGPLLTTMLLADGATVDGEVTQPRVEPEIGIRFGSALSGDVSWDDVLSAVEGCFACLEIVDSVFTDYCFTIEDNTADGSSAALVVVGDSVGAGETLDEVSVRLERNRVTAASAFGDAALGHPLNSVVWLVAQLDRFGRRLEPGDIVITGGLTSAVPLDPGDEVRAIFDDAVHVTVRRANRSNGSGWTV